jgi:hypothetical protein
MDALLKALGGKDRDLTLAILKAWEQVGDEKALPAVERLAAGTWDSRVRAAADACLPALRQRAELARQRDTLLRPASAPGTGSEVLLRPAAGPGETSAALLLRPVEGETDGDTPEQSQ